MNNRWPVRELLPNDGRGAIFAESTRNGSRDRRNNCDAFTTMHRLACGSRVRGKTVQKHLDNDLFGTNGNVLAILT